MFTDDKKLTYDNALHIWRLFFASWSITKTEARENPDFNMDGQGYQWMLPAPTISLRPPTPRQFPQLSPRNFRNTEVTSSIDTSMSESKLGVGDQRKFPTSAWPQTGDSTNPSATGFYNGHSPEQNFNGHFDLRGYALRLVTRLIAWHWMNIPFTR